MKKIKIIIFKIEDKFPLFGKAIISLLRFLRFYFYYKLVLLFIKINRDGGNLFRVYWINPNKIQFICDFKNMRIDRLKDRGKILDGDWDLSNIKFEENIVYKGIKERFMDNKPWEETILYKKGIAEIRQGEIFNGCHNEEKFKKYIDGLDKLYKNIKEKGYIPRYKIEKFKTNIKKNDPYAQEIDEIKVGIGRHGQVLFFEGNHRLSIAKILGIKKVAVRVFIRHKKWTKFKNELLSYAKTQGGKLYQNAYHFDLYDIPYIYGKERFNLIKDNLLIENGTVLDIGANFGYFCHMLEKMGFDCTAVEINPQEIYFMEKLKKANEDKFKIVKSSIFDFKKGENIKYDIVLALYIFHHFLKRKKTYNELISFLSGLDCKEMFLGAHNPEEPQMQGAYKNYEPEKFVQFIIEHSKLNHYLLIKEFEKGRRFYKLYE